MTLPHAVATGTVHVPLPAAEAFDLFTPEGERVWAEGWDPAYPAGAATLAPGTVFTTDTPAGHMVWVVQRVDRPAGTVSYARVAPGNHAGTITVVLTADGPDRTTATVTYDVTALAPAGAAALERFEPAAYVEYLDSWTTEIAAYLAARP